MYLRGRVAPVLLVLVFCSCAPKLASMQQIPRYNRELAQCRNAGRCAFMVRNSRLFKRTALVVPGRGHGTLVIPGEVYPGTDTAMITLAAKGDVFARCNEFAQKTSDLHVWVSDGLTREVTKIAPTQQSTRGYVSRNARLSTDRVIVLEALKWRVLVGRDGTFTDAHLVIAVYDPDSQLHLGTFDVWGRCRGNRGTINMKGALDDAFGNLVRMQDFAEALETS